MKLYRKSRLIIVWGLLVHSLTTVASSQVKEVWVRMYDRPGVDGKDIATGLALDPAGNLYVTGTSEGPSMSSDTVTIKYDRWGGQPWGEPNLFPGNFPSEHIWQSSVIAGYDNVYVVIDIIREFDYKMRLVLSYDPHGGLVWNRSYSYGLRDPYHIKNQSVLAVNQTEELYLMSDLSLRDLESDIVTTKFNLKGRRVWTQHYCSSASFWTGGHDLTVDSTGNIYITGVELNSSLMHYDVVALKCDPNGRLFWKAVYDGPAGLSDWSDAIILDDKCSVYLACHSDGISTGTDIVTIKYNSLGEKLWAAQYDGPDSLDDSPLDILTDTRGFVYVVGSSRNLAGDSDFLILKYDSKGNLIWDRRYNEPGTTNQFILGAGLDGFGGVYATAANYPPGNPSDKDIATFRFDSEGNLDWVQKYDGPNSLQDYPRDMAVDWDGNVYITGATQTSQDDYDYITIRYQGSGLVGYWPMDEGSGTTAMDHAGFNHGSLVNSPQWRPSVLEGWGTALYLDGAAFVDIPDHPDLDIRGHISVAAWIRALDFNKNWQAIVTKGDTAWRLQRYNNTNTISFHCNIIPSGQLAVIGNVDVNDGSWHHVVGVYSGDLISLYVDGELDTRVDTSWYTGPLAVNNQRVLIGNNAERPDRGWIGMVDDVRVYSRGLGDEEVQALYHKGDPKPAPQDCSPSQTDLNGDGCINMKDLALLAAKWLICSGAPEERASDDLIGYWAMEDGDGTTIHDDAMGNNGVLVPPTYRPWVEGKIGGGLELTGDSYVDVPGFDFETGVISFVAWIKGWKMGDWAGIVFSRNNIRGVEEACGMHFGADNRLHYTWNNDNPATWGWAGGPVIPMNSWAMVALVIEPDKATAYVWSDTSGMEKGINNIIHFPQRLDDLKMGWDDSLASTDRYFKGTIDEVRIYSRALNDAEIYALLNP